VFLIGLKFSIVAMGAGFIVFAVAMIGWYVQAGRYAAEKKAHEAHPPTSLEPPGPADVDEPAEPVAAIEEPAAAPADAESTPTTAG
jgi:cytochrome c-type biogenesis protein CcmH/NrfG